MSIDFLCDACGKPFSVGEELAGKRAKCKRCGKVLQIPAAGGQKAELENPLLEEIEPLGGSLGGPGLGQLESALLEDQNAAGMAGGPLAAPFPPKKQGLPAVVWVGIAGGAAVLLLLLSIVIMMASGGGKDADPVAVAPPNQNQNATPDKGNPPPKLPPSPSDSDRPSSPRSDTASGAPRPQPKEPRVPEFARRNKASGGGLAGGDDEALSTAHWSAEADPPGETFELLPRGKLSVPPLPGGSHMSWPATASPFVLLAGGRFEQTGFGVVDLRTGKPSGQLKVELGHGVGRLVATLSPDGKLVAAVVNEGQDFRVWSFESAKVVFQSASAGEGDEGDFGNRLFPGRASGRSGHSRMPGRSPSRRPSGRPDFGNFGRGGLSNGGISGIGFAGADRLVVVERSTKSGEASVFSIDEQREIRKFLVPPASRYARGSSGCIAISPGGRYLALVGDGALRAYELANGDCVGEAPLPDWPKRQTSGMRSSDQDGDGFDDDVAAAPSKFGPRPERDLQTPSTLADDCQGMAFSPDGKELLATFGSPMPDSPRLCCWDFTSGEIAVKSEIPIDGQGGRRMTVSGVAGASVHWTPDGTGWVYGGRILLDRRTGQAFYRLPIPDGGEGRILDKERMLLLEDDRLSGGRLKLVELPAEEIARALAAVEAGGSGIDAGLPPLTEAITSEAVAAEPSLEVETWTAKPDPAPAVGKLPHRALQLGKSKDEVKAIRFSRDCSRLAVLRSVANGGHKSFDEPDNSKHVLESYAMPEGTKGPAVDLPMPYDLLDVSPEGSLALLGIRFATRSVRATRSDDSLRDRLDIWSLTTGKPAAAWRPYGNQEEIKNRNVIWARFVDRRHALTLNRTGELVLWKFPECKAVYVAENVSRLMAMSPGGKYLAVKLRAEGTFRLMETATGKFRGMTEQPDGILQPVVTGFRPDGQILATVAPAKVVLWNMTDGSVHEEFDIPSWGYHREASGLLWFDNRYVLLNRSRLLNVESQIIAWSYRLQSEVVARVSPDDRCWFGCGSGPGDGLQYLASVSIPSDQVLKQIESVRIEDVAIIYPGAKASVQVSLPGQNSKPLVEAIARKLEANGVIVEPSAKIRVSIKGSVGKTGNKIGVTEGSPPPGMGGRRPGIGGRPSGFGGRPPAAGADKGTQVFDQQKIDCTLQISDQHGRKYEYEKQIPMRSFGAVNAKNAQQQLAREMQEDAANTVRQLSIPRYVFPAGASEGLGTSTLSLQGETAKTNDAVLPKQR